MDLRTRWRSPLQRLRDAAIAPFGLDPTVLAELVRAQTTFIESALHTITQLDTAIGALLLSHPKAELLAPLPRIGEINLAQVIAEIGPLLDRCDTADQAAAASGVAPVTRQSGKSRSAQFRFSSNARAPVALTCFADDARHSSPWAHVRWAGVFWAPSPQVDLSACGCCGRALGVGAPGRLAG